MRVCYVTQFRLGIFEVPLVWLGRDGGDSLFIIVL